MIASWVAIPVWILVLVMISSFLLVLVLVLGFVLANFPVSCFVARQDFALSGLRKLLLGTGSYGRFTMAVISLNEVRTASTRG